MIWNRSRGGTLRVLAMQSCTASAMAFRYSRDFPARKAIRTSGMEPPAQSDAGGEATGSRNRVRAETRPVLVNDSGGKTFFGMVCYYFSHGTSTLAQISSHCERRQEAYSRNHG